ncbi:hypothetical protein FACS1894176_06560 [Bacteroidia bacterium]|nr:hypothetical protein FACS189428_2270 [Clostridia bacterium]GHV26239.1 hypothetical protein FACS1894176_06560 [Bacteroidia bacterium]
MSHTFFSHLQSAKKHIYINSFDLRGLGYKEFLQQIHHPYIPETHLLTRDIADRVIANKEQRIIKPTNLFEGQGVYLGGEYSDQEWERLVQENIDQQFVAQEYVQISKIPQYFYDEGEIIEKEVFFDICPHLFIKNGKVLGI